MKWYKHIVFFLVMTVAAWSAVSLEIQNVDTDAGTLDIYMINDEEVGGFQFELLGINITGASTPGGFFVSTSSTTILAFSLTGATIPAGEGILTQVSFNSFNGESICFGEDTGSSGGTAISDGSGNYIATDWGDCYSTNIYGCTDIDACNYDSDANVDDGSCELPMENYDCDENCTADIDCGGECGGTAVLSGCDNTCGSILENDECGVCGGNNSSCSGCTDNSTCTYGNCACNYDASATIDNGSCNYPLENFDCDGECLLEDGCNDCFGIQNGTAEIDDCNTCIDCSQYEEDCTQHPAWNQSCTDCAEELNGNAFIDACGDCVGPTPDNPGCILDCEGSIGFGSFDNCGTCDSDLSNDCVPDCNGDWGGTALIDNCGHCYDGETGEEACVQDCNGDWGGTSEIDNCNVCDGDGSDDVGCGCFEPGPSGCDNTCGSILENDACGICDGSGIPEGDCDCNGNVDLGCGCGIAGPSGCDNSCGSTLENDECGICDGSGIPEGDCDCNGNVDLGCGCGIAGPSGCDNSCGSTLENDECGVCGGGGIPEGDCDCFGSTVDNCGVCGGDNTSCSWTNLTAAVEDINQIALSWDAVDSRSNRNNRSGRECTGVVCLSIENVDVGAGTLDIYMENIEPVGGFQFELLGVTVDDATAPDGFTVSTSSTTVLAFSLTGATIPAGEGILTQVSFSDFEDESICFGEDTGSSGGTAISDGSGDYLAAVWGECACPAGLDECGVCAGSGIPDGYCDCSGNIEDECGVCGGNNSSCEDCADVPNGDNVEDNCGTCDNDPSNDCDMDCSGAWGGSLVNDECGECGGSGLGSGSYYMDCWDGIEYCSNSDCPIDPTSVSYKIYRNGLGIAIAEVQGETGYTDLDLNYDEQYCYTVTYVNGELESHHSDQACAITESMSIIDGCMSTYACNYDESATVDDGSCWFVNTGCSCDAGQSAETDNCGVCDTDSANDCTPDCSGEWGGTAVEDECGVCGGSGIAEGDCDCNGNVDLGCGCGEAGPSGCDEACGSTLVNDECGVCGGDNSSCSDCAGIPNGDAADLGCGCGADSPSGCDEACGSSLENDECGVCGGSGIPDGDCDCDGNVDLGCGCGADGPSGCDEECGSSLENDECGVCGGGGIADDVCDCFGNTVDNCGVCGGDNTSCSWTNLTAVVEEINQIALSWEDVVDSRSGDRNSSGDRSSEYTRENGGVSLEIQNVDTGAGTLDIYMTNTAGCSSCDDPLYNTQTLCESVGNGGDGVWKFDANMDEATCESSATNGDYFDGEVGGFQFALTGINVTDATVPDGFIVSTGNTEGSPNIVAFSLSGATIPAGEGVLMQVSFTDFEGAGICFGPSTCGPNFNLVCNVIADVVAVSVPADWGECACPAGLDECGVCGGSGIADGACDCYGNVEDECDECGGDNSTCADCADVPNGDNVEDNCGTCDNDSSNDCDMDCSGTWGGSLVNDECGACGGDGLGNGSYYMDCWDGIEYCSNSDCPIDPNAVSYKIYRNGLGIAIAQVQGYPEYTDLDLGYNEQYCYTVTYVNGGVESHHSDQACAITESMPIIDGCLSTYACNYDESATVDDGSCWFVNTGCSCDAGQSAETDNCGVCDTDSTNDCVPDCNGDWGGSVEVDECGVCGGNGIAEGECDCSGNVLDECGVCGGDSSTCADCADVPNGDSVVDDCGVCDSDVTNNNTTCVQDCSGAWGGTAVVDDCGVCDSDVTNNNTTCVQDCSGAWGGDLLGMGIYECINDSTISDSLSCVTNGNTWDKIGNDKCGVCEGLGCYEQDCALWPSESFDCYGNTLAIINPGLIPETYKIHNIYPNPFNPVTNIEFGLPENTFVQIIVYDIKGRQIATLMNSFQFAGYYSLTWDASDSPSGVYFIDMTSDGFKQTRQVVLMK